MLNLVNALKFAQNLSIKVGNFLVKNEDKVRIKKYKDKEDILTNIDLRAEKIILEAIQKKFPKHNLLSEEKGLIDKQSTYTWIIDPLDGTKEYARGLPLFGSAFLLEKQEKPLIAVVSMPKANLYFSASLGKKAFLNNKKISVSEQDKLSHSFIYSNAPIYEGDCRKQFLNYWLKLKNLVIASYRLRFLAFENLSLCFLASGGCEAVININRLPKKWDFFPGLLIAQEAGARITNLEGKKINFKDPRQFYLASNGRIHKKLLKILS